MPKRILAVVGDDAVMRDVYLRYDCYPTKKKTGKDLLVLVERALEGILDTAEELAMH